MRALNLYSKILLSFLALLLLSQVLMVGTFLLFSSPTPQPPLDSHLRSLANLAQRLAQEGLARRLAAGQPREEALRELALELAGLVEAKVWFSAGDRVLAQSFAGPTPDRSLVPPPR